MAAAPDPRNMIAQKDRLRRRAYDARNAQAEKDRLSRQAIASLLRLPEYQAARTVMWYVDCRSELRTRHDLPAALASDKRIVVPYCRSDASGNPQLGLWLLESVDELVVGKWQILEPPCERWSEPAKSIQPAELDVVIVPGVAFSRVGGRIGNGQGYYDRLLVKTRSDCWRVALCYECQLFDDLAVDAHDVFMDRIVTEFEVYRGPDRPRDRFTL